MYLSALHVVQTKTGREGFNAFHYAHPGSESWRDGPPASVPDIDPGVLVEMTPIPPGGNRVRSYLDIFGRDDVAWEEIRRGFVEFIIDCEGRPFPWPGRVGKFVSVPCFQDCPFAA
jgi:hypothetical protein